MVMISKDLTRLARWFEYLGSLVLSVFFQLKLETLKWKVLEYREASKNYATWPDMYLESRKISEEYRKLTWPDMPVKYWRQPSGAADGLWIQLNWGQSKKKGFSAEYLIMKLKVTQIIHFYPMITYSGMRFCRKTILVHCAAHKFCPEEGCSIENVHNHGQSPCIRLWLAKKHLIIITFVWWN